MIDAATLAKCRRYPLWWRRCWIIFLLPIVIVITACNRIWCEGRHIFSWVYYDVAEQISDAKQIWGRHGD